MKKLNEDDRAEAIDRLNEAINYLTLCWDAMNALEGILNCEVLEEDISPWADTAFDEANFDEFLETLPLEEEAGE